MCSILELNYGFSGICCCFFWIKALLVSDFGPKITIKIVESLRDDILAGKLKSGSEIKVLIMINLRL